MADLLPKGNQPDGGRADQNALPPTTPAPSGFGTDALGYLRENVHRLGLLQGSGSLSLSFLRIVRAKIPGLA